MSDNKIFVSSKIVEISENKAYLELVNRVCFYDEPNLNGTMLPFDDTAEEKALTLKNMPVVAKYTTDALGKPTFKGHEVSIDKNGDVVFGTTPIGVHTDTYIQDDEVEISDGSTKTLPCLFAKQRIWSRNKNAVAAIQRLYSENNLHNSWEISVSQYVFENGIKKLTDYAFEGNAFIGVAPAYGNSAQVLSVASRESELLVAEALSQDLLENDSTGNEVQDMEEIIKETTEPVVEEIAEVVAESEETTTDAEINEQSETVEKAELTMRDLRMKMEDQIYVKTERYMDVLFIFPDAKKVWAHVWEEKETDIYEFTYEVQEDEVILSEPVAVTLVVSPRNINSAFDEKNSALVEAQKQINELSAQIGTLAPYKEAAEKAEREAAEAKRQSDIAELRQYAEASGVLTNDEIESAEISALINDLKTLEVKALIADRIVGKSKKVKPIETSQKRTAKMRTEINYQEDSGDPLEALRTFIGRV